MAFTTYGRSSAFRVNISQVNGGIASEPPQDYFSVKNLYVDPQTGKLIVEYDDEQV